MKQNYGKFLREERQSKGISQETLAKGIGITQAQISYYESGTNEPTIGICIRIADFYGISLDELFGREIPKQQNINNYQTTINIGGK